MENDFGATEGLDKHANEPGFTVYAKGAIKSFE